ncbi:hypothetical protein H0H87_006977 [Tephrocybe sp. NHM501043]|nr:hypothetical protein H0H87_006977 [Tephrocybe sp. NHM501043]
MSTIARYLSSALSGLSFVASIAPNDSPGASAPTLLSRSSAFVRGLIPSTSPYSKGIIADPKASFTTVTAADTTNASMGAFFDASLISDSSSSSDCNLPSPQPFTECDDFFSPHHHVIPHFSLLATPSPPHLVGLGISGVSRKDGKAGNFDGFGLVGVRRSFNLKNPFIYLGEDYDDEDDGYTSPTPIRVSTRNDNKAEEEQNDELSETFMRELVFTWEVDLKHTRGLCTIPECDDEDELEFQETVLRNTKVNPVERVASPGPILSPEPWSPASSSSSSGSCSPSLPSPSAPACPLTLRTSTRPRLSADSSVVKDSVPRSSRNSDRSIIRANCISAVASTRGRTVSRSKDPSGLSVERDEHPQRAPRKKVATKGIWRG